MSAPPLTAPSSDTGAPPTLRYPMTYEEYRARDWGVTLAEWKDGEVIVSMSATERHQCVVGLLCTLLTLFVSIRGLGRVYVAPLEARLHPEGPSREPDVFFVATEHLTRMSAERLSGGPDLAVEVISDDSVGRDRGDKFDEYEDAGVREYWIIDPRPRRQRMDLYVRDAHGRFRAVLPDAEGIHRSALLDGFWLRPDWLWADPPPAPLALLAEILGLPPTVLAAFGPPAQ